MQAPMDYTLNCDNCDSIHTLARASALGFFTMEYFNFKSKYHIIYIKLPNFQTNSQNYIIFCVALYYTSTNQTLYILLLFP